MVAIQLVALGLDHFAFDSTAIPRAYGVVDSPDLKKNYYLFSRPGLICS